MSLPGGRQRPCPKYALHLLACWGLGSGLGHVESFRKQIIIYLIRRLDAQSKWGKRNKNKKKTRIRNKGRPDTHCDDRDFVPLVRLDGYNNNNLDLEAEPDKSVGDYILPRNYVMQLLCQCVCHTIRTTETDDLERGKLSSGTFSGDSERKLFHLMETW